MSPQQTVDASQNVEKRKNVKNTRRCNRQAENLQSRTTSSCFLGFAPAVARAHVGCRWHTCLLRCHFVRMRTLGALTGPGSLFRYAKPAALPCCHLCTGRRTVWRCLLPCERAVTNSACACSSRSCGVRCRVVLLCVVCPCASSRWVASLCVTLCRDGVVVCRVVWLCVMLYGALWCRGVWCCVALCCLLWRFVVLRCILLCSVVIALCCVGWRCVVLRRV